MKTHKNWARSSLSKAIALACLSISSGNIYAAICTNTITGAEIDCVLTAGQALTVDTTGSVTASSDANYPILSTVNATSITINAGGTVTGTTTGTGKKQAILLNASTLTGDISNAGTIIATRNGGVDIMLFGGSSVTNINNSGTLNADNLGIFLFGSTVTGNINNTGNITGTNYGGIAITDGSTVTGTILNDTSGVITTTAVSAAFDTIGSGIEVRTASSTVGAITNNGTINGGTEGIAIEDTGVVTGAITNTGTISGVTGIIVDLGGKVGGGINNSGTITGSGGTAINLSNSSTLDGTNAITVTNSGTITGAVLIGHGTLNLEGTGSISGAIVGDSTNTGKTVQVDSAVNVNGTFTSQNTITAVNLNINNGGTLNQGHNLTISGGIINAGTTSITAGTVTTPTITNTGTFTSTPDLSLTTLTNSGTFTANGALTTTTDLNNTGTLTATGTLTTPNITNSGTMTAGSALSTGTVVNSGTFTGNNTLSTTGDFTNTDTASFSGALTVGGILSNSGILTLSNGGTVTGNATQTGTLSLAQGTLQINGNLTATASTFTTDLVSTSAFGKLTATGSATLSGPTTINLNNIGSFADQDAITFIAATGGVISTAVYTIVESSALYSFAVDTTTANQVNIIVTDLAANVINNTVTTPNAVIAEITPILSGLTTGDIGLVVDAIEGLVANPAAPTAIEAATMAAAIEQLVPALNGQVTSMSQSNLKNLVKAIYSRSNQQQGTSSGDLAFSDKHVWIKPYASVVDQGTRQSFSGYHGDSAGFALGIDGETSKNTHVGAAFSYTQSDIRGDAASTQTVDTNTWQAAIYMSQALAENLSLNVQGSLGYSQYDSSRSLIFGGINRVAKGDYNGWHATLGAELNRSYPMNDTTTLVGSLTADYAYTSIDSYTETGAGGANLSVASDSADELIFGLGAGLIHQASDDTNLSANINVGYDTMTEASSVSASLTGGGAAFNTSGMKPDEIVYRGGVAIQHTLQNNAEITARYDIEARQDYDNQTVSLNVRWKF